MTNILYKFVLNEDLRGEGFHEYSVNEHPDDKSLLVVSWDEPEGEECSIYNKSIVEGKIKKGIWVKVE